MAQGEVLRKHRGSNAFFEPSILLESPHNHHTGSSPNPALWVFMEKNHWLLETDSTPRLPPLLIGQGVELNVPTSNHRDGSLATSLHPQGLSKSHLSNISPGVVERGLL